jgi:hypothetical protein
MAQVIKHLPSRKLEALIQTPVLPNKIKIYIYLLKFYLINRRFLKLNL